MIRRVPAVLVVLVVSLLGVVKSARADRGAWIQFEYRQPIYGTSPSLPRFSMRVWSDTRLNAQSKGLAQQFLRVGPIMDVTSWFYLAIHGTIYADRRPSGAFEQEARLELEPNFYGRIWHFTWNDRNRIEYRWRESAAKVRYRNQLRINYAKPGLRFIPFVTNEWLVDFTEGFNENRLNVGLGFLIAPNVRIEVGYLLRSRDLPTTGWTHDHLGLVYMFVGPPVAKKP